MATTITDLVGRPVSLVAASCLGLLAACGGGSSGTPPVTLQGATYWLPSANLDQAELRTVQGGSGAQDFRGVIFLDDGFTQFLEEETFSSGVTLVFETDNNNVAVLRTPDAVSPSQYGDLRLLQLRYVRGGQIFFQEGVIGRFTSESRMATAAGSATYIGSGTAAVRVSPSGGAPDFSLGSGDTTVIVDFDQGSVNVLLGSFAITPPRPPFDEGRIDGMTISGNEFSGGGLVLLSGGSAAAGFAPTSFASSGVFAGWNDTNGNVDGGDKPAEVGGAFVADTPDGKIVGRYAAD